MSAPEGLPEAVERNPEYRVSWRTYGRTIARSDHPGWVMIAIEVETIDRSAAESIYRALLVLAAAPSLRDQVDMVAVSCRYPAVSETDWVRPTFVDEDDPS